MFLQNHSSYLKVYLYYTPTSLKYWMYQNKSWARNSTRLPLKPAYHGHISCNSWEPVMVFVCFCLVAIDSRSSRSLKGFARLLQRFTSNIPAHEIWWQQRYAPSYSVARKCKRSPLPLQICNDVTRMVIRQRCRPTSPDSSHVYCNCSSSRMVLPAERAHCMLISRLVSSHILCDFNIFHVYSGLLHHWWEVLGWQGCTCMKHRFSFHFRHTDDCLCIRVETRQAGPFRLNSLSFFNLCGQVGYSRIIPTGGSTLLVSIA